MAEWNPNPIFAQLDARRLLAALLFGEARGESLDGQLAVANVVANRVARTAQTRGKDPAGLWIPVILKPWAFSCFDNDGGLWNEKKTVQFAEALVAGLSTAQPARQLLWIAQGALDGALPDVARGATHYYVRGTAVPRWALGREPIAVVDPHLFYRLSDTAYT